MSLASTDHPRPALIRFFRSPSRPYILLLLMVFAAAAALRLYGLDTFPQGFHHDEAIDALAAQGILRGEHPIFFTNVNPREPLMIYLQSVGVLVFGATKVGARVMQGLTGTASVVVAWFLLRDLFGRRVALLGAAFMAISLWHVVDSRIGMRSISQPLLETACLLFFWRLAHSARWRDAVLAGVFLGGTLYTYSGARALPILLVVLVGWQALTAPGFVRRMWAQVLAVAGIGLVVFAPLGIYFIQNPDKFYGRSLEVNVINPQPFTGSAGAGSVWQETLRTLAMFSFRGDAAWKYNIGGQPVFDWPVSLLFYGGILIALLAVVTYLRTSRKRRPLACAAAFSLLGGLIMLLPSAISSEAPTYLRTIGSMPMVFAFPALTLSWLMDRWRWCAPLAGLLLVAEGAKTGYDYFAVLGHSTDAYYAMHGPAADVALLLNRQPTNAPVLFSSEYPGHPTVQYLAPAAFPGIRWFNGRESVAFPPPGSRALYVFSDGYTPGFTSLGSLFPADALVAQGHDPGGATAYEIFNASGPPAAFRPASPVSAQIANVANLDGFTVDASTVRAGGSVRVQEYWHVTQPATRDLRMFVHAVDAQGNVWAQADGLGFYGDDWRPGDSAVNDQVLSLPAYTPPLPLRLEFGVYHPSSGQRLQIQRPGTAAAQSLDVGTLQVTPASNQDPSWQPTHLVNRAVAPGLTLAGFDLPQATVEAGGTLPVDLYWRVDGSPVTIPALELAGLRTASASPSAEETGLAAILPPAEWPHGVVEDRRELHLPAAAQGGSVGLGIGGLDLARVTVTEPPRAYSLPSLQHPLNVPLSNFATLAGYDLSLPDGGPLQLTLVWQDRASVSTSYKVFVHVLDGSGQVVAQRDQLPLNGAMPTTLWLPQQVIVDPYTVAVPVELPTGAQLEVGMYNPENGQRVPIGGADHQLLPLSR